jgi:hypothetical protein
MVNERQQQIIQFQNDQIEALLKKLGKKRLLLEDDQRRLRAKLKQTPIDSPAFQSDRRRAAAIATRFAC